jgi:hypothetical protein
VAIKKIYQTAGSKREARSHGMGICIAYYYASIIMLSLSNGATRSVTPVIITV